jgi:hypothetical protein
MILASDDLMILQTMQRDQQSEQSLHRPQQMINRNQSHRAAAVENTMKNRNQNHRHTNHHLINHHRTNIVIHRVNPQHLLQPQ